MPFETPHRRTLGTLALSAAMVCVIGAPLALGAHSSVTVVAFGVLALMSLALHIIDRMLAKRSITTSWLGLPIFAGMLFTLTMLVPLPSVILEWLSPFAFDRMLGARHLLPESAATQMLPVLSLDPPQTMIRLLQLVSAACIFVVISDRARSSHQRKTIFLWILIGCACLVSSAITHRLLDIRKIWGLYACFPDSSLLFAPLVNINHLSKTFAVFSLLCFLGAIQIHNRYLQLAFGFCAALSGMCVPLATSRGGTIVFILSIIIIVVASLISNPRNRLVFPVKNYAIWLLALLLWSLVASLYINWQGIFAEFSLMDELAHFSKFDLYIPFLSILQNHWLMGIGSSSLAVEFFAHLPPNVNAPAILSGNVDLLFFENVVLQTLADHGLIKGLILFFSSGWVITILLRHHFQDLKAQIPVVALFLIIVGDFVDYAFERGAMLWLASFILALCAATLANGGQYVLCLRRPHMLAIKIACIATFVVYSSGSLAYDRPVLDNMIRHLQGKERIEKLFVAVAKHPFDVEYAFLLAIDARAKDDLVTALRWAERAVLLRPNHFSSRMELARTRIAMKQFDKAIDQYRLAFAAKPLEGENIIREVSLLTRSQAIRLRALPDRAASRFILLCHQLESENREKPAQLCYNEVARLPDATLEHIADGARFAIERGDKKNALRLARKLLDDGTPDGKHAILVARAMALQYGIKSVLSLSETWLKNASEPCPLIRWRADAQLSINQMPETLVSIGLLRQCPGEIISSKDVDLIEVGLWHSWHQPAKALQILRSLAGRDPSDIDVASRKMRLELDLGLIDSAEETYHLISSVAPEYAELKPLGERLALEKEKRKNDHLNEMLR